MTLTVRGVPPPATTTPATTNMPDENKRLPLPEECSIASSDGSTLDTVPAAKATTTTTTATPTETPRSPVRNEGRRHRRFLDVGEAASLGAARGGDLASAKPPRRPTVALVGCGPSGMFFLHALATRRREYQRTGNLEALARLPLVTCYESADAPGGLWRPRHVSDGARGGFASSSSSSVSTTTTTTTAGQQYRRADSIGSCSSNNSGGERRRQTRSRSPRSSGSAEDKQHGFAPIYDSMWTNLPKEAIEFADYTFAQHYDGRKVPTFLLRKDIYDYILDRTLSVDADLYGRSGGHHHEPSLRQLHTVKFGTKVLSVSYDVDKDQFVIESAPTTPPLVAFSSSSVLVERFDFCIWAAGQHGKPRIPKQLLDILRTGGSSSPDNDADSEGSGEAFRGAVLHSAHTDRLEEAVRGRRIVLIGDAGSAEDICLQAVKLGAAHVDILSRSGYGDCAFVWSWPSERGRFSNTRRKPDLNHVVEEGDGKQDASLVDVHIALPFQVVDGGTGLLCCEWYDDDDEESDDEDDEDDEDEGYTREDPLHLKNIDTVVFCTGYLPNQDFVGNSLKMRNDSEDDFYWSPPKDFVMRPNPLTPEVGEIQPAEDVDVSENVVPGVFRNVLMSNPRMMFLTDLNSEFPLLELDVAAWLCLAYITGEASLPSSVAEMRQIIDEEMVQDMQIPFLRWSMDSNYFHKVEELAEDHWSEDYSDSRTQSMLREYSEHETLGLAIKMKEAGYPVQFLSKAAEDGDNSLSDLGKRFAAILMANTLARTLIDPASPDASWRTFRDTDVTPFSSLYTQQSSIALKAPWLFTEGVTIKTLPTVPPSRSAPNDLVVASNKRTGTDPPTVALIGCGPSGMFFLHALATWRRELRAKNDAAGLAALPKVVCFDAQDGPGGLWRKAPATNPASSSQGGEVPHIYETMWTLSPKECIEFSDYTFQQHFGGRAVPPYLPGADIFDYLLKRTQSVDPRMFDADSEQVRFGTRVQRVAFDSERRKFDVKFANSNDDVSSVESFDYCVWAAGQNAKPRIPLTLLSLLRTGKCGLVGPDDEESDDDESASADAAAAQNVPFRGTLLHSSHVAKFEAAAPGKRVVLIGDAGSAEDLALHAVRLGAEKAIILSRSGFGDTSLVGSWPGRKEADGSVTRHVTFHLAMPYRVVDNGRGLLCGEMYWDEEDDRYEIDDSVPIIKLENIDVIVFCTGYMPNLEFLDPSLRFLRTDEDHLYWSAPSDFRMRPNQLTPEVGHVEPSKELILSGSVVPGLYHNVLISNPRMMFLMERDALFPLLSLDVAAWMCLANITGRARLPPKDEMERSVEDAMLEEMHIPFIRWSMDMNYYTALDDLGEDHWCEDLNDERSIEMLKQYTAYFVGVLARDMKIAQYPISFGSGKLAEYKHLNDLGKQQVALEMHNVFARSRLDRNSEDSWWRTFRDADPSLFVSLYTGQAAAPLPCKWIEVDSVGTPALRFSPGERKDGDSKEQMD